MRTTCTECGDTEYARGLCARHYQTARYHGQLPEALPKTCEHCSQVFTRQYRNARYCSRNCKDAALAQRRRAEAVAAAGDRRCLNCGKLIQPEVTLKAKYCSRECNDAWRNRKRAEEKRAAWAAEGLRCEECGELIPIPTSGPRRVKYCSWKCKHRALTTAWRRRSPHYMREYLYGLSQEQYEALLVAQDSRCAICGSPDWPAPVKAGSPHVDHDSRMRPGSSA